MRMRARSSSWSITPSMRGDCRSRVCSFTTLASGSISAPCCWAWAGAQTAMRLQIANALRMRRARASGRIVAHAPTRRSTRANRGHAFELAGHGPRNASLSEALQPISVLIALICAILSFSFHSSDRGSRHDSTDVSCKRSALGTQTNRTCCARTRVRRNYSHCRDHTAIPSR